MAGLKKPTRGSSGGSPNIVLVIFLVLFVLSTGILGLLLYLQNEERRSALYAKTAAENAAAEDKKALAIYRLGYNDMLMALGPKLKEQLSDEDKKIAATEWDAFIDPKQKAAFTGVEEKKVGPKLLAVMADLQEKLGLDKETRAYSKTYADLYNEKAEAVTDLEAKLKKANDDAAKANNQFAALFKRQDGAWEKANTNIVKGSAEALAEAKKRSSESNELVNKNLALNAQIAELTQEKDKVGRDKDKEIRELTLKLKEKTEQQAEAAPAARSGADPHALVLDISLGKPLFDEAVGEITRVDAEKREVTINLGSAQGVKPELTFNVFAKSPVAKRRAGDRLKGTVEVVRVLGPNASVARITSLLAQVPDPDQPSVLHWELSSDWSRAKDLLHEGDQLFNMFWRSRVAIAGYVNVTGFPTKNPTEQMRQLADFAHLLERQGVIVDAWLDLTDGEVKGKITPETRFLIRGDDLEADAKDADKDAAAGRAKKVSEGMAAVRKEAVEKGLFIISARNFANVIGYRRPLANNQLDPVTFRPTIPLAGTQNPTVGAPPAPGNMPPEEKKAPEKGEDKEAK